jgi:acyl-CoA reductase-like NAD-dependent aldehyde dehydrogenase
MDVHVHIEELLLDPGLTVDAPRVSATVEVHLAELIARDGLPAGVADVHHQDHRRGDRLTGSKTGSGEVGARIAETVLEALDR